jgi:transcriptional regulator with XRE-family HTH domain
MTYGFPGTEMITKLEVDGDKIRRLRIQRAWSQEQLADVAGIGYRTVQRIETSGKATFESLQAIAAAFELSPDELQKRQDPPVPAEPPKKAVHPIFLARVTSGQDLFNVLGGAHAGQFGNDELRSQREVDVVGPFMQDMHDYMDIWNEIEPSNRVQEAFDYTERIRELTELGLSVFANRRRMCLKLDDGSKIDNMEVAIIQVIRSDNPAIVRIAPDGEVLAVVPPPSVRL